MKKRFYVVIMLMSMMLVSCGSFTPEAPEFEYQNDGQAFVKTDDTQATEVTSELFDEKDMVEEFSSESILVSEEPLSFLSADGEAVIVNFLYTAGTPYRWYYEIEDESIVICQNEDYLYDAYADVSVDSNDDDILDSDVIISRVGGAGIWAAEFDGIAHGSTKIRFWYTVNYDGGPKQEPLYEYNMSLAVTKSGQIIVTECPTVE